MRTLLASFGVLLCGLGSEAWALRLRAVDVQEKDGGTEVVLRLDAPPERVEPALLPERRLVLDLPGATNTLGSARIPGKGPCLTAVRIGEHPGFTRAVLDLAADCTYRVQREERAIRVQLGERDGERLAAAPEPSREVAREAPLRQEARPLSGGSVPVPGSATPRGPRGVLLPATEPSTSGATRVARPEGVLLPALEPPPGGIGSFPAPTAAEAEPHGPSEALPVAREIPEPSAGLPTPEAPPGRPTSEARARPSPAAELAGVSPDDGARQRPAATAPAPDPAAASPRSRDGEDHEGPSATGTAVPAGRGTSGPAQRLTPDASPPPVEPQDSASRDEARVSVEFEDVDVRTVLDLLARAGGREVIFRPGVEGRVRVKAADRPWRDVFDQVLRGARLEAVEHDGLLLVSPAAP